MNTNTINSNLAFCGNAGKLPVGKWLGAEVRFDKKIERALDKARIDESRPFLQLPPYLFKIDTIVNKGKKTVTLQDKRGFCYTTHPLKPGKPITLNMLSVVNKK
jgi:hypothetical protein